MSETAIKMTAVSLRGHPDLLTVKDLQKILNIGRTKTYSLVRNGFIRSIRVGAEYRIPKSFLLEYLNRN